MRASILSYNSYNGGQDLQPFCEPSILPRRQEKAGLKISWKMILLQCLKRSEKSTSCNYHQLLALLIILITRPLCHVMRVM